MSKTPQSSILLVDDDAALLQALPQALSLRLPEIQVMTADSAVEAIEQVQQFDYDAIVSDIKMPGMDGLALLSRTKELRPETPMLMITGHGEHDLAIQALRGGAYDFIQKPIDRDYFVAALSRAIQTHQLRRQVVEQQLTLELHAKSLEHLVQQRTHELVEAIATKDKVISIVSHELNRPILHLKEIAQLLHQKLARTDTAEIVSQGIADIEESLGRTEVLVQELLNTSSIETEKFILHRQRCDLIELCRAVLEEYTAGTGSILTCECLDAPMEVEVDVDRFSQLLSNLLTNTHQYSMQKSPIKVVLQRVGQDAIISMSDIDSRSQLGLGFYVSRKIVERHGGRLEVQSFPDNRNTCFVILPLYLDSATGGTEVDKLTQRTQAVWMVTPREQGVDEETSH
jgi:YesN/AraC family two-component response regulator